MTDNLRERPDEKENDLGFIAADDYPYIRFKSGVRVLKFIIIEQMPVIVARYRDILFWYGFYKGQWYTDFLGCPEGDDPTNVIAELLEKAEELYMNDLKEPVNPCAYPYKSSKKCSNSECLWCHPRNCCSRCSYRVGGWSEKPTDIRCMNIDCDCGHKEKVYQNAVCRGSWALGTACGHCERCLDTKPI